MSSTLAITADWHLGIRQFGLNSREQDFYDSAENLVNDIIKTNSKIILNAGDIFDSVKPSVRAVHTLAKINQILIKNHSKMYYIEGNHDKTDTHWTDAINLERKQEDSGIILLKNGECVEISNNVNLYGFSYINKKELIEEIDKLNIDKTKKNILMLHISCKEITGMEFSNDILKLDEIPNLSSFNYIIIGDTHKHLKLNKEQTIILSPGSIELCSSNELADKYYFSIDLIDDTITSKKIKTRSCYKYKILTKEDLDKDSKQIFEKAKAKDLIYIYYNKELLGLDLITNFCNLNGIILRTIPLDQQTLSNNNLNEIENINLDVLANEQETKINNIIDFAKNINTFEKTLTNEDLKLKDFIVSCLNPNTNSKELIINYLKQYGEN